MNKIREIAPMGRRILPPHYFFLLALCFLPSQGCSQSSPIDVDDSSPSDGRHVVQELPPVLFDSSSRLTYDFPVVNDTGKPIRFQGVRSSCGCSNAELTDQELAPGQETKLHLEANLHGRSGPQHITCQVMLNKTDIFGTYTLKTTVRQRVSCAPQQLLLGVIDPNQETTGTGVLYTCAPVGTEPPRLLSFRSDSPELTVTPQGEEVVENLPDGVARRKLDFQVTLTPQRVPGRGAAQVVAVCDHEGSPVETQLPVVWTVRNLFILSPGRVYFGQVGPSAEIVEQRLKLRRADHQPLVIRKVTTTSSAVTCAEVKGEGSAERQLVLKLNPALVRGSLWGEAVIETDHPVQPTVKVSFSALR